MKPPCLWEDDLSVAPIERQGGLDTPRTQRVVYLVQCISFDFMDQDPRNLFC
jgi:hypothetical protein